MNRKLLIAFGCFFLLGIGKVDAQAPIANFSATPTSGCSPVFVQFKDLSGNNPQNWNWDFGNGQTSSLQNPYISFSTPGTYTVTLIARNASGADAIRMTDYITVYPSPTVSFTSNLTVACSPANIQFSDHSQPGAGGIASWAWGFGDGAISSDENPAHTYTQTGYYTVTLKVTNTNGCSTNSNAARYLRIVDGIEPNFAYNQVSTSCTAPYTANFLNQTSGPGTLTYNWNLGNGATPGTSTDPNPTGVVYPTANPYTISLQVQSSLGCSQSFQKSISFNNYTASFDGPAAACVNTPATFTNTSSPTPASSVWDFGNGSNSPSNPATVTYTSLNTYNVKLVNRYAGCSDSITKTVQVQTAPTANFTADVTAACQPNLTVHFTDGSTGSTPTKWAWDFGDGGSSTDQNPTHQYTHTGTFDVKLTVTNAGGCTNTTTKSGFVNIQAPTVTIDNAGNLGACVIGAGSSDVVTPTATVNSVVPVTGYNWLAPGSVEGSGTSATPSFHYSATGTTYTITLTVTTAGGCTSAPATSSVSIGTPVIPDFTISSPTGSASVCGRDSVTFTATPTGTYIYTWAFGDGATSKPQTLPTIKYAYNKPFSPANIALKLTNQGCPSVITHPLTVNYPFPNFGYKLACGAIGTHIANFTDSSLTDGGVSNYTWDFGDGTGAQTIPAGPTSHSYAAEGVYSVTLTMTDGACTQSYTKPVIITQVHPSFTITQGILPSVTPAPSVCKVIPFQARSTTTVDPINNVAADKYIHFYIWQVDANPVDTTTDPEHDFVIPTNGPHTLHLLMIDTNGCQQLAPDIPVNTVGPTSHFTPPSPDGGCKNTSLPFTDQSTPGPEGPIASYSWNFGDNTTPGSGPSVTHTFSDTGYFHISLKVTDAYGCADTYTPPDSIQITSPIAAFSGPDSFYCPGVPLHFIDSSRGYNIMEAWTYGDPSGATDSAVHTFATPGQTYSVTLKVTDKYNCSSTLTKPVLIQKPVAAFDIADTTAICTPLQTQFTSHAQYYDSLYWDFGDGTTSTLPVTSHFYNTIDTFVAKLYVQGPGGCMDSASRRVLVLDPIAITKFSYSPLERCDSVPVNFSLVVPGYTQFTLAFGDGQVDSSGNTSPFHMYRNVSHYSPSVQLTDATGCIVGVGGPSPVFVLGATPFFNVSKHAFCDSSIVNFVDYTISNNGYDSETYTFGDGSPAQTQLGGNGAFNISNYFAKAGTWPVTLTVSTDSGCTEKYTDTIRVYQTPHPLITLANEPCAGIIQFNGTLDAPQVDTITWAWNFGNGQTSGQQNPAVQIVAGSYTISLKASTSFGCADTTSTRINVYPDPEVKGPKEITTPLGIPVTIPLTYSGGITSYSWSPATNLDCPTCPNPVATLLLSTQYAVTVTDTNNCKTIDSIFIKTICTNDNIFMPNTFSPNGDGVNDVFYPRGKSLYNVQSLSIFNRWGQMVFQRRDFPANSQDMGWDGNFNGHPAPSDAYVYIVEVICENAQVVAIHGSVTLVR